MPAYHRISTGALEGLYSRKPQDTYYRRKQYAEVCNLRCEAVRYMRAAKTRRDDDRDGCGWGATVPQLVSKAMGCRAKAKHIMSLMINGAL